MGRWSLAILVCFLGLGLRVHRLAEPLMRWDEGWSVAHASLSCVEVIQVASWEFHPPLFYLLLKLWLALGRNVFVVRFLSVLAGTLAVPLTFQVAMRWTGRRPLAWLAAGLTAVNPALVYYAQVARMYALVVPWLLLVTWALLRWLEQGEGRQLLALLVIAGLGALYTFYYTAWALAGLYAYGLLRARRRRKGLFAAGAFTLALHLPWLAYAGGGMLRRLSQADPDATVMPVTLWDLTASTWTALTFDFGSAGWGAIVVQGLILAALLLSLRSLLARRLLRREINSLLMPVLPLLTAVGGAVLGSGAYFFAPRMLTPAVPFLVLLVAWSLDRLGRWWKGFLGAGLALLALAFWPTCSRFVYQKSLEVSGPFEPHEYHAVLSSRAEPGDFIFFNELALAGWYEMDRKPDDPAWGYALRWTPIVEPMERIRPRVKQAASRYTRLWFVLYQGTFGPGAELKGWLDGTLYPSGMYWGSDALFLAYLAPKTPWVEIAPAEDFGGLLRLEAARYSAYPGPAGEVGVVLKWRALQSPVPNCRVVVQAWDDEGNVWAHRDVQPVNWERATCQWAVGEVVEDRHGLLLAAPGGGPSSDAVPLHLAVSLYDEGKEEFLPVAGGSFLELGVLSH